MVELFKQYFQLKDFHNYVRVQPSVDYIEILPDFWPLGLRHRNRIRYC